jgi:large subunit ribosomal protein L10
MLDKEQFIVYNPLVANPKTAGGYGHKFNACRGMRENLNSKLMFYFSCLPFLWADIFLFLLEVKNLPNAKVLEQKQQLVAELSEKIAGSVAGIVVDYKGTTVADDTALRKELREAGIEYFVVKNTLLSRAIEGTDLADMKSVLEGTTAIALSKEDHTAAARILNKFAEAHENFTIKSGFLDGKLIDNDTIVALAKLPSRDVLLATVLGAFQAPIAAFARAVQAIVDKDGSATDSAE